MAEDDDKKLAELIRDLPGPVAHSLCTSNLINSVQACIYEFNETTETDVYDLLLLKHSYMSLKGVKIESVKLAEIIFSCDKENKAFIIDACDNDSKESLVRRERCSGNCQILGARKQCRVKR